MEYLEKLRTKVRNGIMAQSGVAAALSENADPKIYARYLENVWHYAQHSSTVIGLAGTRCVLSHPPLAQYLLHHAQEELGHDQWALQDLAALGVSESNARKSRPVPACAAMVGFEYYIAGYGNPVALFGWLYVLEAMGDDLGQIVADSVSKGLNLPDGVKFLAGHGDADVEHTVEIIENIKTHIKGEDLDDVHHVADVVSDLYVRMFAEIFQNR